MYYYFILFSGVGGAQVMWSFYYKIHEFKQS